MNTICNYLDSAIAAVEDKWGDGAGEKYPQVVAALIAAAAQKDMVEIVHVEIAPGLDGIARAIDNLGDQVSGLGDK